MLQGGLPSRLSFFSGPAFPAGAILPNGGDLVTVPKAVGQPVLRSNLDPLYFCKKHCFVKGFGSEYFCGDHHKRFLWDHF